MTTLKAVTETVSDFGKETEDSIREFGRSAGKKMDEARDETGGALHAAASCVRQSAKEIDHCAARTADRLDATGSYVEDHDLRGMLRSFGRRHITGSLVMAAAIGFLAGSALRRVTHSCARSGAM